MVNFIKDSLGVEVLVVVIMNFEGEDIDGYDKMVRLLSSGCSNNFALKKINLDLKNRVTPLAKPFIKEPLI